MASLKDVAKKAGVSTATVSRVINNHASVSWEVRRLVHEAMNDLSYLPNKSSISLDGKRSGLLGCIVPNLTNPHFSELIMVLEQEARFFGMDLIVKTHLNQPEQESIAVHSFISLGVEGLFWVPTEKEYELADDVRRSGIVTVVVTQRSKFFNSILLDSSDGMRKAAFHIKEEGWRCAGFVGQQGVDVSKYSTFKEAFENFPIICKLEEDGVFWLEKGICESINFNSDPLHKKEMQAEEFREVFSIASLKNKASIKKANSAAAQGASQKTVTSTSDSDSVPVAEEISAAVASSKGALVSALGEVDGEMAARHQTLELESNQAWLLAKHVDNIVEYLVRRKSEQLEPIILWVFNDVCALVLERACLKAGLKSPEDYGLITFDNTYLTQILDISSIGQPIREIAKRSYNLVADYHRKKSSRSYSHEPDEPNLEQSGHREKAHAVEFSDEISCIEIKPSLYVRASSKLQR